MKFPYIPFEGKFLPIVPIKLKGKEWVEFNVFVDTGASYSMFHPDRADILGINFRRGRKEYIKIGDGSFIAVYLHEILVSLAGEEFKAEIGFSENLGVGFDIMGRKDIFERFVVVFDEKGKFVEFLPK